MALFKVFKGNAANLMANKPNAVDGYCYFTIDDGKFYIDVATAAQAQIGTNRIPINAKFSDVAKTGLMLPYTVCNSAGSLISKEITIATEGWELQVGSMIAVYFANANAVANPTLCINGGDPVPIYKVFGKKAGGDIANSWDAGSIVIFFYTEGSNGTNQGWVMANWHDPQQTIDAAIAALDVAATTLTQAQTIKSISETDGKIVVTKQAIKITKSQISDFPTTMPNPNKFTVNTLSGTTTNKITDYDGSAAAQINFKTGSTNGTFAIDDGASTSKEVAIKGLNTAAYQPTTAFATAAQGTKADNAMPKAGGEFTGNVTFASGKTLTLSGDPVNDAEAATKQYVDNKISQGFAANDAMVFKGIISSDTVWQGILGQNYSAGWTYRVGGSSGFILKDTSNNAKFYVEPGDLVICVVDKGASASADNWIVVQANLDGAVTSGLTSVTAGALAAFSGTSGKTITKAGAKGSASLPVYVDSNGVLQTITSYEGTANIAKKTTGTLSINNKTFNGSADVSVGTIGIAYGGTGATSAAGAFTNIVAPGGAITGNLRRYYGAASTEPMITALSSNQDILLFEVGHGTAAAATTTSNHYKLKYVGTGATPNNYLQLIASTGSTDTIALQFDENGNATFAKTVNADISGTAKKVGHTLSINNKTFDGSADVSVGTIGTAYGGTGNTAFTANKLIYAESATKLSSMSASVGGGTKLWYINAGTPTESSSNVGNSSQPVYLLNGVVTALTGAIANDTTGTANIAKKTTGTLSVNGKTFNGSADVAVGTMSLAYGGTGATDQPGAFAKIVTPGGTINGEFIISNTNRDTSGNTKGLYIRRGTGASEQAKMSINDSGLYVDLTNDEANSMVVFNMTATDTERASDKGADAFSNKQVTIVATKTETVVTADRFNGTAERAKKLLKQISINGLTFDGSADVSVGTIGIAYGGTGATTAANARYNLIGSSDIGSASVPVYWNKTDKQFKPITSYSGTAAAAQKLVTVSGSTTTDVAVGGTATPVYFENGVPKQITSYGGNAATATQLSTSGGTGKFWRGDNSWSDTLVGPLYINNSTDAAGTNATGALIIGNKTGANIAIDDNEVMARNNSATATLYLNNDGGLVQVGAGGLTSTGTITGNNLKATTATKQTSPTKIATLDANNVINHVIPSDLVNTLDNANHKWVRLAGDTMAGRLTAAKGFNNLLTGGTGTVARDAGASASPRYFPAQWKFNADITVADGDIFTIKIPCAGHSYGVFLSVNNGTNFYPVAANGTGRITTHYPANTYITVVFESSGSAASMTPLAGANAANGSTISGGVFRVINYYDANTTYSAMSVAEMKTGTATTSRVMRADYLKTFLSTLGGTSLTLTHDATNGLVLNHDNSGVTANTYGNTSQQAPGYGATFNVPYFTVNAQGHITAASTTTVKLPAETHYTTHLYAGSGTAENATTTNGNTKLTVTDNSTVRNSVTVKGTGSTSVTSDANGVVSVYSKTLTMSVTDETLSFSFV